MKAIFLKLISLLGFQDMLSTVPLYFHFPGSLVFDRLIDFHDYILIYLIFILVVFCWFLFWSVHLYRLHRLLYVFLFVGQLLYAFMVFLISTRRHFIQPPKTLLFHYLYVKQRAGLFLSSFIRLFLGTRFFGDPKKTMQFFVYSLNSVVYKEFVKQTRRKVHAPLLETFWTIFPSFILLLIAIPSIYLLYIMDAVEPLSYAVKVIGHQWYWSYEIGNCSPFFRYVTNASYCSFDSYLTDSLPRLLVVDNVLFVPSDIPITFFITSTDVIHSWSVPSLGIKVDAIPGRLNQVCTTVFDINIYYGQCSELCGVNHGFMPINIVAVVDNLTISKINKI